MVAALISGLGRLSVKDAISGGVVLLVLREALVWLELSRELGIGKRGDVEEAIAETDQLIRIFVSSIATAKRNDRRTPRHSTKTLYVRRPMLNVAPFVSDSMSNAGCPMLNLQPARP